MNCNKPYTIAHISEIDIDNLASVPDYFLGVRSLTDQATGNTIYTPVRVPGEKVMPTGNLANVIMLSPNNEALEIPDGQVRAGYIETTPGLNIMRYAGGANKAMFLMVGKWTDKILLQTTGWLTLTTAHKYIVGRQYYLGEDGQPTTDNASGQKLFMPIDDYTLSVNGDF